MDYTNNKGVEPAMEWLLAHSDDAEPAPSVVSTSSQVTESTENDNVNQSSDAASSSSDPAPEAKSLKCDEW